jgi:hypothetical protein
VRLKEGTTGGGKRRKKKNKWVSGVPGLRHYSDISRTEGKGKKKKFSKDELAPKKRKKKKKKEQGKNANKNVAKIEPRKTWISKGYLTANNEVKQHRRPGPVEGQKASGHPVCKNISAG